MKKIVCLILPLSLMVGCSSVKTNLADMQTRNLTKKLADGTDLHFNMNVTPSAAWKCKKVGATQSYNWDMIQTQGQFQFSGPYGLLADKAADYLNQNHLTANYVNMGIPETSEFTFADSARLSSSTSLSPNATATLTFYNCQQINPDHQVGAVKKTNWGLGVGKGADNANLTGS